MIRSVAMMCPKQLLIFLWICVPDLCRSQDQITGPFRVLLRQIEQCDEIGTGQIYANNTRISKVSRTKYIYSTNVTTEVTITDEITTEVDIAQQENGMWRPHYLQMEFPKACTSMKQMMPVFYNTIKSAIRNDGCPIPPGTYEVKDLDMESFKAGQALPGFPYGKYRSDLLCKSNGTLIGCIRTYFDIVPVKRERKQKKPKNTS